MSEDTQSKLVRDQLEVGEYKDFYDKAFSCRNCGKYFIKYIRRGWRVERVDILCTNCGCKP